MDVEGDPHPHTPAPTNSPEELARQARRRRKKAMKKARREELKKLSQEAVALELEQGPSELHKEDPDTPQVRQISPPGALATEGHGHPETPAPAPTNPPEEQHRPGRRETRRLRVLALQLEQGPRELQKDIRQFTPGSLSPSAALATVSPETSAPDTQDIEERAESIETEPARLRHSFPYSDRPRRSKRSTRVEEHVGEVSSREFEALTLDQSPPAPDSTHRIKKDGSAVSNRELEARTIHQSPPTLDSTPSIEEYALEVRALKLAQSPPTLDSTHRSNECADDTTSETGPEILEEKPKLVPLVYRPVRVDILELLIAHSHGYSDPVQHKLDAQAIWAKGMKLVAPEDLASQTENRRQGEASRKKITENGMKWMGEEVMLAFKTYIEGNNEFKDMLYCFDEIQHQCFSVESYNHTFHHFNFTVKMKKKSDDPWLPKPFFAELKEVYGRKYYSCYELSSYDDGHCSACKNQGMVSLQHPILGLGYEGGHAAIGGPFAYFNDDDDDYFD